MYIEELLSWLWRASWQASVLVLLVLIAQSVFRSRLTAKWRHALWFLVLARLMLPVVPQSPLSIFNYTPVEDAIAGVFHGAEPEKPAAGSNEAQVFETPHPHAGPAEFTGHADPESEFSASYPYSDTAHPHDPEFAATEPLQTAAAHPESGAGAFAHLLFGVWMAGAALLGARLIWANARFARRLRREQRITHPGVLSVLERCKRDMGVRRELELIETDLVETPALFGIVRLKILLPRDVLPRFTTGELRHVFLHELAHIRRGDPAVNWLVAGLQLLHWFNPVLWFAFRRMRADRELACDALALSHAGEGENRRYGETILKLFESFTRPAAAPGLVGIVETKQQMKLRMRLIAQFRNRRRWLVLAVVLLGVLALAGLTDARTKAETDELLVVEPTPIDLSAFYDLHAEDRSQFGAWESVPKGRQLFDDVPFEVDGMIRLFGTRPPPHGTIYREQVTGIPVERKFHALHVLHGTGWTGTDGTLVARIVFNYADGARVGFPIVYGEHVRDWWRRSAREANRVNDPNSALVWEGHNRGIGLRFYRTTFFSPHADRVVESINIVSAKSLVTPAIVAMTMSGTNLAPPARIPNAESREAEAKIRPLDLTPFYDLHAEEASQFGTWEVVPKGRQVFGGVPFDVGGMIRLFGLIPPPHRTVYRDEVTGIPVGETFKQLHLLHGTGWTTNDGETIARVVLRYADGEQRDFPVIYGEHVRDWWHRDRSSPSEVSDPGSSVAWTGEHERAGLRFYRTKFENPRPEVEVAELDLISKKSAVTPAIVSISVGAALDGAVETAATAAAEMARTAAATDESEPRGESLLRFRVIDAANGEPLAGTGLQVGYCDDRSCRYLGSFRTGDNGEATLTYPTANLESLSVSVVRPGFASRSVHWNVRGGDDVPENYTVELTGESEDGEISGRVIDAETGQPIPSFRVFLGEVQAESRIHWRSPRTFQNTAGEFSRRFRDPPRFYSAVRVEAEGYLPAISELFRYSDPGRHFDFSLEKAEPLTGIVRSPEGDPVAGAEIALLTPNSRAVLGERRFARPISDSHGSGDFTETDEQGRFVLSPDPLATRIVAVHEEGFVEIPVDEFYSPGEVTLREWGTIEGVHRVGGQPNAGQRILVGWLFAADHVYLWQDHETFQTRTDEQGRFRLESVPPVPLHIHAFVESEAGGAAPAAHTVPIDVKSGDVTHVQIGGTGRPVAGKFVADNPKRAVDWQAGSYTLSTRRPRPSTANLETQNDYREWSHSEEVRRKRQQYRRYRLFVEPGGSFRAEDIPPGEYELSMTNREPAADDADSLTRLSAPVIGSLRMNVTLPEPTDSDNNEPFDLGEFTVELNQPVETVPRPHEADTRGSDLGRFAPDFSFTDLNGNELRLSDFRGQYVLLDFWATWCGPCLAEKPNVKATYEAFGGERFEVIGLSLDRDRSALRRYLEDNNPAWTQGHLGPNSDVTTEFGVRGIPAFFLIDPEGRIAARGMRGERIKAEVARALEEE